MVKNPSLFLNNIETIKDSLKNMVESDISLSLIRFETSSHGPFVYWGTGSRYRRERTMIILKEKELYQELDIFVDDTKIGDAEIELNGNELARFRIYEPYQNKGYGTKVLLMLIEKYGCNNLWVKADNERAKHVYEKCGFEVKKPTVYLMERTNGNNK